MRRAIPLLVLSLLASGAAPVAASPPVPGDPAGRTYVVLPFENLSREPSLDWLSAGLALSLGDYLEGFGSRVVDEEEVSLLMEEAGIPSSAVPTLASALEMGRRTRALPGPGRPDRLVLGRFDLEDAEITLMVRSIDLTEEKGRPWVVGVGHLASLLDVQQGLAVALALGEGLTISGIRADTLKRQLAAVPLLAFETYCRAMGESDSGTRLRLFRRAVQEFPGYPAAAYQAASLLAMQDRWDEAATMLERAASPPAPDESAFYLLGASVALERNDPPGAVEKARRALEHADTPRGRLLLGRALLASGDRDGARAELEKVESIDPGDPEVQELRRAIGEGPQGLRGAP